MTEPKAFHRSLKGWVALLSALIALLPFAGATAQEDTLDPGVAAIVATINSGEPDQVATLLEDGPIVRATFPGHGEEIDRETAQSEVRAAVVSHPQMSDSLGSGRYAAIAVWVPTLFPEEILIVATGLNASGERITTGFITHPQGGSIWGYGRITDLDQMLAAWDEQGVLTLLAQPPPLPPVVGNSPDARTGAAPIGALLVIGALMLWCVARSSQQTKG